MVISSTLLSFTSGQGLTPDRPPATFQANHFILTFNKGLKESGRLPGNVVQDPALAWSVPSRLQFSRLFKALGSPWPLSWVARSLIAL